MLFLYFVFAGNQPQSDEHEQPSRPAVAEGGADGSGQSQPEHGGGLDDPALRDVKSNKKDVGLVNIFLYEEKYVPAPRLFWKVLHDQHSNTAAVFIGLNDPHKSEAPPEVCPNRCAEMSWVDWEMADLEGGYMYCCDLQAAAAAFPEIASLRLSSSGLLQGPDPPSRPVTTTQALQAGLCRINLDQLTGKYPPLLLSGKRFVYPTSEDSDGSRYLNFGLIISSSLWILIKILMQKLALSWSSTVTELRRTRPRLQSSLRGRTQLWSG